MCPRPDLHPLAVEDVLYARRTSLSKADYYSSHLFISTLCHSVKSSHVAGSYDSGVYAGVPNTFSPMPTFTAEDRDCLPQPATTPEPKKSEEHWSRHFSGSHQPDKHTKEEVESEPDADDGVNWISDGVSGTSAEEKQAIGAEQADYYHNEVRHPISISRTNCAWLTITL